MAIKIHELPEYYRRQVEQKLGLSGTSTNVESSACNEPLEPQEAKGFNGPVIVRFLDRRKRLPDADGACGKYLLDAIVTAGLLQDDSRKYVTKVEIESEKINKGEPECVIITMTEQAIIPAPSTMEPHVSG